MKTKKKQSVWRTILFVLISVVLGFGLYSCNAQNLTGNLMPMPFGVGMGVVMSGSMEPKISVDDFIVVVKRKSYSEGEIVVFQEHRLLVVHEIVAVEDKMVTTKGTANNAEDKPIPMSEIKGEVVLQIKGLGKVVHWMKSPLGTALILGLSFLCLIKSYEKEETDLDEAEEIKREIERLKSADSEKKE